MRSYDVEGMHVGTVAAGRIGLAVLRRLKPFDMHLHYTDRHRLPKSIEKELGLTFHKTAAEMIPVCDVVTINAPLHPETENLFDDKMLARMKRGAYLINTARAKICDRDAVVRALESGQLAGYAGDVWFPQPAPKDHPWRTMPHHGMTPHISGTSLSAQARYATGTREILECFQALARSEREDDLPEMCIGAHVREGGVGFGERIDLVDWQAEFVGFQRWQQIGPHAAVDLADFFCAAGTEGDADVIDALHRMQVEIELALHAA
jgi:phosphoglycerate dehydrogenase-like enzyme